MYKYSDILKNKFNLSPSIIQKYSINNKKKYKLRDLLDRELPKKDNGVEIGSASYMTKPDYYFLKTKCLKNNYFTPIINNESAIPMNNKLFKNYFLKKGDLIISKDSNIGECVILDQD